MLRWTGATESDCRGGARPTRDANTTEVLTHVYGRSIAAPHVRKIDPIESSFVILSEAKDLRREQRHSRNDDEPDATPPLKPNVQYSTQPENSLKRAH
jgi:hypothetical protein